MPKSIAPNAFDYSMMSTFCRCHRRYYWRYVREYAPKARQTPLEFGKAIHLALDVWYKTHDPDATIAKFAISFIEDPADEKRTLAVGKKLLSLYMEKYAHEGFKILATELPFEVLIKPYGFSLIGRIDKIIEWDKAVYIMDHKTTSRLGYEFFYKIKPNLQFDGYIWAARTALGFPTCSGVVLDALLTAKGLTVPAQLAKLQPLGRDISTRTAEDMEEYQQTICLIVDDMRKCYDTDVWYKNTESCCDFIECPYRRICKEDTIIHEKIAEMDFKKDHWDPRKADDATIVA